MFVTDLRYVLICFDHIGTESEKQREKERGREREATMIKNCQFGLSLSLSLSLSLCDLRSKGGTPMFPVSVKVFSPESRAPSPPPTHPLSAV